ncbi:tetraacyldisaccharide 4'-kinase [Pedobacter alpinus]|uniref:Tetraacyldisaccharide 4'-kinase n=1 Tax=Pedobacter alpinus TaxID=1590643 RepID=A0ABW5TQ47_9SPHI
MSILRFLLFPLSFIYGIVTYLRNKFYDWGIFKSQKFNLPIISVGNLEVGGSGKTPMVEYLINLLKNDYKLATLSRGYGRKTTGFRWVKPDDNATLTGDEPLQISQKFTDINVAVCENRAYGITEIQKQHQLILMDDAFQHRAVKPGFSILLFDYHQLRKTKLLLPAGNYRELFSGRKRANILVVTKCPNQISESEKQHLAKIVKPYPHHNLFFTNIVYSTHLNHVFNNTELAIDLICKKTAVLLLTGIAKPEPLINEIKKYSTNILHHAYADHHAFSQKNMLKLVADFEALKSNKKIIITTQKDAVRLRTDNFTKLLNNLPIYEWPININFVNNTAINFDNLIKEYAQLYQRIS